MLTERNPLYIGSPTRASANLEIPFCSISSSRLSLGVRSELRMTLALTLLLEIDGWWNSTFSFEIQHESEMNMKLDSEKHQARDLFVCILLCWLAAIFLYSFVLPSSSLLLLQEKLERWRKVKFSVCEWNFIKTLGIWSRTVFMIHLKSLLQIVNGIICEDFR